jgi:excisionase family DNA binding protein
MKPGLLVEDAAKRLGVSHKSVLRLIEGQKLDALKAGPKLYFIPEDSLQRYMERAPVGEKAGKATL